MPPADETKSQVQEHLGRVKKLLGQGTMWQLRQMLNALLPVELARLIASSPPASRTLIWDLIDKTTIGEVLEELPEEIRADYLSTIEAQDIAELTEGLETDDLVDILQQLPEKVIQEVLEAMDNQDRERVEKILPYAEDTAGGLANTDTITVRPRFTLDVVLRYLRMHADIPPATDALIVVNRKDDYLGMLPLATLLTSDPDTCVRDVMVTDANALRADMQDTEVAKLFEQHDWISAPVVNENGKLIGRITIDDVVDVIRDEANRRMMNMAGLDDDEDTFATVRKSTPRRAIWLGVNLLTCLLASSVINLFQGTIDKVVALAVLMPIVASMGGVAGSQTLTMVIRGMAIGQIGSSNLPWLINRELAVGFINGLLWAMVMGTIAGLWFQDPIITFIISAAMIVNLLVAALAGATLPTLLRKLNIDPALAGGVTLTTVTDVVGFFTFLGLASLFYA